MNKFLHLQTLIVASVLASIMCQHYPYHHHPHMQQQQHNHHMHHPNAIPAPQLSHSYHLQQHHPAPPLAPTPQHHQQHYSFQASPSPSPYVDLDKFNHHAKSVKDQINYFNHQEQKNLRNTINSVHQEGNDPHFDFVVNANYTDLEKASEQFVSLGNMAAKQNMPKVIKITKTVAVKQPVPVPYPVPVSMPKPQSYQNYYESSPSAVSYTAVTTSQKPQTFQTYYDSSPSPATYPTTEKPYDFKPSQLYSNYTSYISKYPTSPPAIQHIDHHQQPTPTPSTVYVPSSTRSPTASVTPASMAAAHKIAESYIKQEFFATQNQTEYDTRPFYVTTSDKEMIKYIPVPYYVDEQGVKHEIANSDAAVNSEYSSVSGDGDSYYKQTADTNSGKFYTQTFSYHPPPTPSTTTPTPTEYHHHQQYLEPQALHATPHTNYYYTQGEVESVPLNSVDSNVSPSQQYAVEEQAAENNDNNAAEHEHVQYKYVYER